MQDSEDSESVRKELQKIFKDPFVKILAENSSFTKIQLETLLIDYLAASDPSIHMPQRERPFIRNFSEGHTRGSFNRTLIQAKKKLRKTLYSVLLLGYVGIFESPDLIKFVESSQKLREYITLYSDATTLGAKDPSKKTAEIILKSRIELEHSLKALTAP